MIDNDIEGIRFLLYFTDIYLCIDHIYFRENK